MISGFKTHTAVLNGQRVHFATGGRGPAVLLLHGFPQTHAMWHQVAPDLARDFTVIAPDLRGYGASGKPDGTAPYGFRPMAHDQIALLDHLGVGRCHVVGHDRGGRVAHRLALDAPERLASLTVMDIVPTHHLLSKLQMSVAKAYYHWFFLAQPAPFPEHMIAHNPDGFFESCLLGWGAAQLSDFDPKALAAYRAAWRDPDCIRGMCADYLATLEYDFDLDATDAQQVIACPSLVLYGAQGKMAQLCDVGQTWAARLSDMQAKAIRGGHFFVDENPKDTITALRGFLT